jgi:hypothetical protein
MQAHEAARCQAPPGILGRALRPRPDGPLSQQGIASHDDFGRHHGGNASK